MASNISDYDSNFQNLKTKIQVNLDGGGLVDYTSFLQDFSVFTTLSNETSGLISTRLDASLRLPEPSQNWAKQGLKTQVDLSISNDEWISRYNRIIFSGATSQAKTISSQDVKLVARQDQVGLLTKIFNSNLNVFTAVEPTFLIKYILLGVGYEPQKINLTATSISIPTIILYPKYTAFELINKLCKISGIIISIDDDGFLTNKSFLEKFGTTIPTPAIKFTRSKIKSYPSKSVPQSLLFNKITVKGKKKVLLILTIFENYSISGEILSPNQTKSFFIKFSQKDIEIVDIINTLSIAINNIYFNSLDDGTGAVASSGDITLLNSSILRDFGKGDTVVFSVRNNTASTWYWKGAKINGPHLYTDSDIVSELSSPTQIVNQGAEIVYTIESDAIQTQGHADYLATQYFENFVSSEPQIYSIEVPFRPDLKIAEIIEFEDVDGVSHLAQIIEIDADAKMGDSGGSDGLFMATLTLKKILS